MELGRDAGGARGGAAHGGVWREGGADDGEPGGARAGALLSGRYGLEIRAATEGDAGGLAELFGSVGVVVPARLMAGRIAAARAGGAVLVAMEWGPPSGVVAVHWFGSLAQDEPVAQMTTLLVGPDARRRGIGRLLVKAASQAARAAGCGVLEVVGAELGAFCGATGFAREGERFVRGLRRRAGGSCDAR